MANRLDIRNAHKAIAISQWCQENLKQEEWQMETLRIFPAHYKFEFTTPQMSTIAALST